MIKNINKLALLLKYEGVKATVIMPRSIAASLSWQSSFIGMNQALRLHPLPFDVND